MPGDDRPWIPLSRPTAIVWALEQTERPRRPEGKRRIRSALRWIAAVLRA